MIEHVAVTGSTNADMLARAAAGAPEGQWLVAARQDAGRGRQGRAWQSPPGNLHASTLVRLRPGDPPAASLALVAAVATEEALGVLLTAAGRGAGDLAIKWPNDVLLGGAKIAGILLERAGDAVVIGIGANVASHPVGLDRPVTSLAAQGVAATPTMLAETLAEGFARWLGRWRGEGLAPVRARWLDRAHPVGTALSVATGGDDGRIEGLFDGLDGDGALLLKLAGGERVTIRAGDVFLL